jgi:hypothetical protein
MRHLHAYATETGGRKSVPLFLAAASIGFTWLVYYLLSLWRIVLPWWIEGPSILGFYGIFYSIFDEKLWKVSFIRRTLKIPNLNGSWAGYVKSSYDDFQSVITAELNIAQTWTRMSITMRTQTSKGSSLNSMMVNKSDEMTLNFEFLNEPDVNAPASMHMHRGTARLSISSDAKSLDGDYYTGRDRNNFGIIHFERISARDKSLGHETSTLGSDYSKKNDTLSNQTKRLQNHEEWNS